MEFDNTLTFEEYKELREIVKWTAYSQRQYEAAVKNSLYLTVLREDGRCIGMSRAIGDGGYSVLLADVIVHPDYQGRGLGRMMLEKFMKFVDSMTLPGETTMITLVASKGKEEFYEKFGFIKRPDDTYGCGMTQWYKK